VENKTWRRYILFGLISCLRGLPVWAEDGRPPEVIVTIAVHNHAGVPPSTLAQAERTASSIFKQAGVDVDWANCEPPTAAVQIVASCRITEFPKHLQLTIARRSMNLTDSVLGVSYVGEDGSGCYSNVFFEPAEELHKRLHVDLGTLLGHVVAHELGHLLLGTNSHSDTGIMRPHWNDRDLANAGKGELLFTQAQCQKMKEKVAGSLCRNREILVAAGTGKD
jgi:hypothetical protein